MFLVKKRADMHGNCVRGRKCGDSRVGGKGKKKDWTVREKNGRRERERKRKKSPRRLSATLSRRPKRPACLHAKTALRHGPITRRIFVAGFSRGFMRQP